ncbi:MAG TPA: trypsin-like peptidase domain-containing protein [Candidatus Acidoferrum sp.]|nr:trypsin-like peptidase domain-containing protein [Candidatus Acidoferrum sp.]
MAPSFLPPANLVVAPGDELLIVGYPRGFSDVVRNYPIVRMGAVASSYPTLFQGQLYFLVDARLHPGTSGSPVFAKPTNPLRTSSGTAIGDYHMFFLGVNSGEVNLGGESSGLNAIWYATEVVELTGSSFHSQPVQQP